MPRHREQHSRRSPTTRLLTFGVGCLVLAIVAGLTASWIPLTVLVVLGAVFVARGLATKRS